jgi:hypothetical protein
MSLTSDEALERLLGSDRVLFTVTTTDEHACADLLAEILPRHVPLGAAEALATDLAAKAGPIVVSDRWLRLWFLSWRLGP